MTFSLLEYRWTTSLNKIDSAFSSLCKGRYPFLLNGGGGEAGASEGRVINKFLQIGEGQPCFIPNRGRVTVFFGKEKITPYRLVDSYLLTNT